MCAKASNGKTLLEVCVGFIGSLNRITVDKSDIRILIRMEILLFAGSGYIVAAIHDGLHPVESCVARRAHLVLREHCRLQNNIGLSALM